MNLRKWRSWLLFCALAAAVSLTVTKQTWASKEDVSSEAAYKPITHFDEVTLIRTPCYGWCPWYEVKIRGDGRVDYEGKGAVITGGNASKSLSKKELDELILAINQVQYTSIPAPKFTRGCNTDGPSSFTSVTIDGKRHELKMCGYGKIGRFEVGKFENQIDKIVKVERWLGSERERQILFDGGYISTRRSAAEDAANRGDIRYLETYAELGDPESLFRLALGYSDGLYSLNKDPRKALDFFILAANRGVRSAQKKLMEMYESGVGAPLDYREAYYWRLIRSGWPSKKILDRGNVENNLTPAEMAVIEARAKAWKADVAIPSRYQVEYSINQGFLKSANEGDEWAQFDLGEFYISGFEPTIHNVSVAEKWLRKAAEQGNHQAQSKLSGIYESGGAGVKKNYQEAYFWRRLSATSANNTSDQSVVDILAKHLSAHEKASADKRIKRWKPSKPNNAPHRDRARKQIVKPFYTNLPCPIDAKEIPINWQKQKNGDQTAVVELAEWGGKRPVRQVFIVAGSTGYAYRKTYIGPVNATQADENHNWEPLDPPWDPDAFDAIGTYTGPHNVQRSDGFWLSLTDQGAYIVESNYIPSRGGNSPPLGTIYYRIQGNGLIRVCEASPG